MRRTIQTLLTFGLIVFLSLFSTSCTGTQVAPPDVSLVDVAFTDVSLFHTTIKVTTRVRNESPKPVRFTGSLHRLALNGIDIGKAVSSDDFQLAPLESSEVISTLELSHLTMATRIQDLLDAPSLSYELQSEFYTAGSFGGSTVRSERAGTLFQPGKSRTANRPNLL